MTAPTPPHDRPFAVDTEPIGYAPLCDPRPAPVGDRPSLSFGSMETLGGTGLSSWADNEVAVVETNKKVQLRLASDYGPLVAVAGYPSLLFAAPLTRGDLLHRVKAFCRDQGPKYDAAFQDLLVAVVAEIEDGELPKAATMDWTIEEILAQEG